MEENRDNIEDQKLSSVYDNYKEYCELKERTLKWVRDSELIIESQTLTLNDTVTGMLSEDYKERFKAEYRQLSIRLKKLSIMLIRYENRTLTFLPDCPIEVLKEQEECMKRYLVILKEIATYENINLED